MVNCITTDADVNVVNILKPVANGELRSSGWSYVYNTGPFAACEGSVDLQMLNALKGLKVGAAAMNSSLKPAASATSYYA